MPMIVAGMFMRMRMFLPLPVFLAGQVLFPIHPNIRLRSRNPATHYPGKFQPRPNSERRHSFFQRLRPNSGIHKRAQKHVAAHAGKTLKVGNAHMKTEELKTDFSS